MTGPPQPLALSPGRTRPLISPSGSPGPLLTVIVKVVSGLSVWVESALHPRPSSSAVWSFAASVDLLATVGEAISDLRTDGIVSRGWPRRGWPVDCRGSSPGWRACGRAGSGRCRAAPRPGAGRSRRRERTTQLSSAIAASNWSASSSSWTMRPSARKAAANAGSHGVSTQSRVSMSRVTRAISACAKAAV